MKYFTIDNENNITAHANRQAARDTGAGVFSTEVQFADLIGPDNKRLLEIWNSLPGVKPVTKFENRKKATARIWNAIQTLGGPIAASAESEAPAEIATAELVAQPPLPEPTPEIVTPPVISEPQIPAAEQQAEPATASQEQEPGVAPSEPPAQQTTPFDEPVATPGAQGADVATTTPAATKKTSRAKKAPTGETKPKAAREGSKTETILSLLKRPGGASLKQIMEATSWQAHSVRGFVSGMLTKKMGLTVVSAKSESGERTYSING